MHDVRPHVVVVTPYYPTTESADAGAFVRASVLSLRASHQVSVIHLENVSSDDDRPPSPFEVDGVPVRWIPVRIHPLMSRPDIARAQRDAVRVASPPELAVADVVHAYVGIPTGWAVSEVLAPGVRLVLTEQSSTLDRISDDPEARQMYGQAVARASHVLPVSEFLARGIRSAYSTEARKVHAIPNPVDLEGIPFRERRAPRLARWVFVGDLIEAKGVIRLVRAFAAWLEREPAASLTIVGEGLLLEDLRRLAEQLGCHERVEFCGRLPPAGVAEVLDRCDVLVHLSVYETFGLSVLEAVAAGLPVVATRCGGPEEMLAEAVATDRARLVSVDDGVDDVVEAVALLESQLPDSHPATARAVLERRYSPDRVAGRLRHVLDEDGPALVYDSAASRPLAISLHSGSRRGVLGMARAVVASGGSMIVVTNEPAPFADLGPAVTVLDISRHERRFPPYYVERAVVAWAPQAVLGTTRRLAGGLGRRLPCKAADELRALSVRLDRLRRAHAKFAAHQHPRAYARAYNQIAPWWLARRAARFDLQEVDLTAVDFIVTPDWRATPLAWRILKRNPDLSTRRPMSGIGVARDYAERVAALTAGRVADGGEETERARDRPQR
jgi:glycosyltransferase involved in cell wall biosynthesis